jgi:CDP-paratose 2-epimerase
VKVLITGSSGLIGSELVTFFDSRAECVVGIDNNMRADFFGQEGDRQRLTQTTRDFRHYHLDIRDRAALAFLVQSEGALQPTKFVLNPRGV